MVPYLLAGGVRLARVVYDPDADTTGTQSSGQPGYVSQSTSAGGNLHVFFELGDHLGSTSVVLDKATGELVERATFEAYGATESDFRPERWKSFREDYRFTGKEEDVEVGLQYFGKRYLNPLLGRWISADPLAVHAPGAADLNLYAYVSGAVLKNVDPLGLDARVTTTGNTTTVESNFYLSNANGKEVSQGQIDAFQASLDAVYKDRRITLADGTSHTVHFRLTVRAGGSGSVGPGDNTVTLTRKPSEGTFAKGSHMQLNLGAVNPIGFYSPAHEAGHLLGLADLYSAEFDLSKVQTPEGKIDVTRDPSGNGGLAWIDNAQGRGNLMGTHRAGAELADWQLAQIVGPSLAASRKDGGAQHTSILDAGTRVAGAESAAGRIEMESRKGCVLASAQCAARLSADEQRFLASERDLLKGGADWDKHEAEIRRQLVESRKK